MDGRAVHLQSLGVATWFLETVMTDMPRDVAHWTPPGTMQSIAATYAHAVLATDWQMHTLFRGLPALYDKEWNGKTGVTPPVTWTTEEWGKTVQVDLPQLQQYAQAVYAALMSFVGEADLESKVDMSVIGAGEQTLSWCISTVVEVHLAELAGEISALKGIQGLRGQPF